MNLTRELNQETIKLLKRIHKCSKSFQVRNRAHCILLRNQGWTMKKIAETFFKSEKTIFNWIKTWDKNGLVGLYNRKGQGRKPTFNQEEKAEIKSWVEKNPKNLKKVLGKIEEKWSKKISKKTLTRILKSLKMSWHRMRKICGGKPNLEEYIQKKLELQELEKLDSQGEIDLYYLDESGFSLLTNVPYGWQNIGEYVGINSSRSKRLNVLGIINRRGDLKSYTSKMSINSDVVVHCIETFFAQVNKRTIIVVDQSSIHLEGLVYHYVEDWFERGIEIFVLPSYSPQLNLIEILWRFIKYEWLQVEDYLTWSNLVEAVEKILREYGNNYVINFV